MATIKEDYVSFECAKLLKEKGFDEEVTSFYFLNGLLSHGNTYAHCKMAVSSNSDLILAPTLQMAMRWLLKKYNIFICILFLEESNGYGYTIENIIKKKYIATSKNSVYKEPEEAYEAAIKYCLENLI